MGAMVAVQGALVGALRADAGLAGVGVFDAPPAGWSGPMVVVARHDVRSIDADAAPGSEHRLLLHCWAAEPSRREVLGIAERVVAAALALVASGVTVTRRTHVRTETAMDRGTGRARAAVLLEFASE